MKDISGHPTKREFKAMKMLHESIKENVKFGDPDENGEVEMMFHMSRKRAKKIERIGKMPIQDLVDLLILCLESEAIKII